MTGERPAGEGAALTATAVLDRTTAGASPASPSSPPPFGDDEYARQLNRRLADDRSSAPPTANAPRADILVPAIGLSNHPLVSKAADTGEQVTAEAPGDLPDSQSVEAIDAETSVVTDRAAKAAVSSAPPVPWQQNSKSAIAQPRVSAESPKDLPPTAKAPASPDKVIPQGLNRANEVTTTHSRGVTPPPGLVVAFEAVQQRSGTTPAHPPESDDTGLSQQQANGAVSSSADEANLTEIISIGNAEPPVATETVLVADDVASQQAVAAHEVTQPIASDTASVGATSHIEITETPEPSSVGSSITPSDIPPHAGQPQSRENGSRNTARGREHAAEIVADSTSKAVEAIASSPATPSAGGRAIGATEAIPTALHTAIVERASDAAVAPSTPSIESTANVANDSSVNSLRSGEKSPAAPAGEATRPQHLPGADLADDLPRHAAAALRAAAGFDRPIRIRLSPAELGALQVEVGRHEGALHARFEVTTPAAQAMLHDHLSALRESLGRAGVTVDRIDVRLVETTPDEGRADSQQQRNSSGDHHGFGGQDHERYQRDHRRDSPSDSEPDDATIQTRSAGPIPTKAAAKRVISSATDLIDIQV